MLDVLANISTKTVATKQSTRISIVQECVAAVGVQLAEDSDSSGAQHPMQLPERALQVPHVRQNRYAEDRSELFVGVGELADILLGDRDVAPHDRGVGLEVDARRSS